MNKQVMMLISMIAVVSSAFVADLAFTLHKRNSVASASVPACVAAPGEQCPSEGFLSDYQDWKQQRIEMQNLKKANGSIRALTKLDHEGKGMRDDLVVEAGQECPGCKFNDVTLKFELPKPVAAQGSPAKK
jgi:hypothetical protein